MKIIARKALKQFWEKHSDAEQALSAWYHEALAADWREPNDIKVHYRTADILPGHRVVFNIKGNHYRLIAKIHYNTGIVFIRFIGTHKEYDRIDASSI